MSGGQVRSTRNGAEHASATPADVDLVAAAASLRWSRPDLTASLADHVLEVASAEDDAERWLAAAGWAVHARSATGDGRVVASEVLDGLPRWGASALSSTAAHRLRVELAVLATGAGEMGTARALLAPVTAATTAPELRADAYCALARCAAEEQSGELEQALRRAEAAWSEVGGQRGEIGAAAVALVAAAAERRAGRAESAVDRAAAGLAGLDRGRGTSHAGTPSGYLAAALTAEWISALLDAGRLDEARNGCIPLERRLREKTRPSRQISRLRLTVARTVASGPATSDVIEALELAASDAADSDAPDLEAVCRSALGALHEKAGKLEVALESMRLGVAAQRRDQHRVARFQASLEAALPAEFGAEPEVPSWSGLPSVPPSPEPQPAPQPIDEPTESFAAQWQPSDGESPIGDVLARSLRVRNGVANGGTANGDTASRAASPPRATEPAGREREAGWASNEWSHSRGWVPTLDAPSSGGGRRRRRAERDDEPTGRPGEDALTNGRRDSGRRAAGEPSRPSTESTPPATPERAGEAGEVSRSSWLESALAELDRVWGRPTQDVTSTPPPPEPEVCTVVIDVAREGRRFAGRRARAVVNAVAERLTGRLPADAQLRYGDTDALSVVQAGWSRSSATEWMYRTLPGMLEGFVAADELPGTQLRASVHNAEGPVGAQLLQRLDLGARSRDDESRPTNGRNGRTHPAGTNREQPAERGRHDAAGRSAFRAPGPDAASAGRGRRHREASKGQQTPEPAPAPESVAKPAARTDTDGLGLADLLAGALAAYRGI